MEEFYETKAKDIMIPADKTPFVEENAGRVEFLTKLSLRAHAWVINNTEEMKIAGILTEHDILRSIIPPRYRKIQMFGIPRAEILHKESIVQDIMTHNPAVCYDDHNSSYWTPFATSSAVCCQEGGRGKHIYSS
jgi:CBS domain-containing protein